MFMKIRVNFSVPHIRVFRTPWVMLALRLGARTETSKQRSFHILFSFPSSSSSVVKQIYIITVGAPLRRLAEGHRDELLCLCQKGRQKFSRGWASVPGSLDQFSLIRERAFVSFLHQLHLNSTRFGGERWGCGTNATFFPFSFWFCLVDRISEFTCKRGNYFWKERKRESSSAVTDVNDGLLAWLALYSFEGALGLIEVNLCYASRGTFWTLSLDSWVTCMQTKSLVDSGMLRSRVCS